MEVILLEKIANLGSLGDKVSVKPGFARNYLVPQGKAKPATAANLEEFESKRAEFEAAEAERLIAAQTRGAMFNEKSITIAHQAGEEGKLFGSVTTHEVAECITAELGEVGKQEIRMPEGPIRSIGEYVVEVAVHSDVVVNVTIIVEASE